jgi:hypothetical protein
MIVDSTKLSGTKVIFGPPADAGTTTSKATAELAQRRTFFMAEISRIG